MKKLHIVVLAICIATSMAYPQARDTRLRTKGYVNPQEIVSLDSTMRMDQALLVIGELSKQFAGKIIVDLEKRRTPIGVYVVNQHWRDALEMILSKNGLTYLEEPEFIRIMAAGAMTETAAKTTGPAGEPPPTLAARDVKISAVFFNANVSKLTQYGISWNFFRQKSKEPEITGFLSTGLGRGDTTSAVPPGSGAAGAGGAVQGGGSFDKGILELHSPPEFKFANIDALAKFFATNDIGEVLTSPEVVVRNGKKGRIQVGKDIYITQRDIAGNTVNQLVSTGTIIDVSPVVYTQSDTDFVWLDLTIEQSNVEPGPEINRTQVKTHALLYDQEETVIGGLYTTSESENREGIPVLKDLPPWFFGLRYLFGSETKLKTKVELIVLLKVELSAPIRNRMSTRETERDLINNQRRDYLEHEKK
jgi:type IV pilus assembly protein PilQ